MRTGLIAQKLGMTRVFSEDGAHVPVTVLKLENCQVVAHRTEEKNGYVALQVGAGPPANLFVAARLTNLGIDKISYAVLPFLVTYMAVIVIISLFPEIVTVLPNAFYGAQ